MSEYKKKSNYKNALRSSGSYSLEDELPKKGGKQVHYFLDAKNKAPFSNEKRFVFMWEEEYATFNFDQYDPIKSNRVLTREDLDLLERELKKTGYYKLGETAQIVYYITPWVLYLSLSIFLVLKYLDDKIQNLYLVL